MTDELLVQIFRLTGNIFVKRRDNIIMMKTGLLQQKYTWLFLLVCSLLLTLSSCGNSSPSSSSYGDMIAPFPVLFQGHIYVNTGTLNIFNPKTGTSLGKYALDKQGNTIEQGPIIADNMIYVRAGDPQPMTFVYALQQNTGAVKWRTAANAQLEAANASMVYVYSNNQTLIALSASSGKPIWQYQTSFEEINCVVATQNSIYICGNDASLTALRANNGQMLWQHPVGDASISGAVVFQGVIYASEQGGVFALNADNGTLLWHDALTGDINSDDVITPFIANSTVYVVADNNAQQTLYALQAQRGQTLWQKALPFVRPGYQPFAVAGQTLYFAAATPIPGAPATGEQKVSI